MTRRRWLATVAGAAVVATGVDALAIEPNRVVVTRHRVGQAGDGPSARLVQLSDLHLRAVGRHEERIAAAVAELRPDLILLTGDAIDRAGDIPLLERFLALLEPGTPKLAILGNWEHWGRVDLPALARAYTRANGRLLRNESAVVPIAGRELLVTGLDDLIGGTPDMHAALHEVGARPDHLLLAHCPLHRDVLQAQAAPSGREAPDSIDPRLLTPQLMLAGHTHGGQIAPFGWASLRPRGSGRYVRGWYRDASTALYVSRGLGTSVVPARLGAAPEVASFEWALAAT